MLAESVAQSPALEFFVVDGGALPVQRLLGASGDATLDLSGKRLGPDSALVISTLLRGNHALTKLVLRNNEVGNRGAHALAAALKRNSTLTVLDLRDNGWIHEKTAALLGQRVRLSATA